MCVMMLRAVVSKSSFLGIGRTLRVGFNAGVVRFQRSDNSLGVAFERGYCSSSSFIQPPVAKRVFPPLSDDDADFNSDSKLEYGYAEESSMYSGVEFSSINGLSGNLIQRLGKLGFKNAFQIQAETLPHTLNGRDVIGRAVTGSGKTLAFALPIIQKLSMSSRRSNPRAIVIAPTRELCRQVMESIDTLSGDLRCVALYGGDSYYRQNSELRRGVDVVCATPGRLRDHLHRGSLQLKDVEFLILDEADELLTPNFKEQIEDVLDGTPRNKQMMLFSATMPLNIQQLTSEHMLDPMMVDLVKNKSLVPQSISHQVMMVNSYNRDQIVVKLLHDRKPKRAIVFSSRKVWASSLSHYLIRNGIAATSLHSDLSQSVRESCLQGFREGYTKVIVATDVAARGIDIPEIDLVIHIDPPPNGVDYYIHRSGRTGRKGQTGTSLLLLQRNRESEEFLFQLRKSIDVELLRPPGNEALSDHLLCNAVTLVKNADPKLSALARKYAEELLNTHGVDALASALSCIAHARSPQERERNAYNPREQQRRDGRRFGSSKRYGEFRRKPDSGFGDGSWQSDRDLGFDRERRSTRFDKRRPRY